ncbi:MAG: addiction module killer protein [Gallionellaceae bacterium]|nr:MAG: addiction module killer protein [Gallionellaceae bacterium]
MAKLRVELGNTSRVKWFDGMGEYVPDWEPGYRIYLAKDGDMFIILFGGGTKRGQLLFST